MTISELKEQVLNLQVRLQQALWSLNKLEEGVGTGTISSTQYNMDRTADQAVVSLHIANTNNPHNITAAQLNTLSYPIIVSNVSELFLAANGSASKFIICKSDPAYSSDPTLNLWDGQNLTVFAGEKRK